MAWDQERPVPYVYRPYPAHVHKAGGQYLVVHTDEERAAALAEGWWPVPVLEADAPVETAASEAAGTEETTKRRGPGRPRKVVSHG